MTVTGGGDRGGNFGAGLRIEPVVSRPAVAEIGHAYLVEVDLRGPADPSGWPYDQEEFVFGIALDGSPHFVCEALGHPAVVLHRFGDTYGPARFVVTAGAAAGRGVLRLSVSNSWGVPVRTAALPVEVVAAGEHPGGRPPGADAVPVRLPAPRPARSDRPALGPPAFVVSHAGQDRAWAAWIGDLLERSGARVTPVRWDPRPDLPLRHQLTELTSGDAPVLMLLSGAYFTLGAFPQETWEAALREVTAARAGRFDAVAVGTEALPAAAALLEPAELGVSAAEAERRLLDRLGLPPRPRPAVRTAVVRFPLETPTVWGGVPRRNPRFTGREELLDDLDLWLRDTTGSASGPGAGSGRCALTGMSGVGKSQIAAEYAHRFAFRYDVVWWVAAGERGGYREQLAALAPALGLRTGQEYGERLRAVLATLRQEDPSRRWLLVLDGADDPGQIADLLPDGPGHVLVTSRNPGWAEHVARLLEVPVYDRAESTAFLRRRAPRLGVEGAERLAEALGDLPLMLAQGADTIENHQMPVADYLELLRRGYEEPDIGSDLPAGPRTALLYAIQSLQERYPESVDLLRLCVFLAPGPVPLRLLRDLPAQDLPEQLAWVAEAPDWWSRALTVLAQQSLVELERQRDDGDDGHIRGSDAADAGEERTIQLHLLVRQVVRDGMVPDEAELYAGTVRRALVAADPGRPTDVRQWPRYAEIVPHLEASGVLRSSERGERALVLNCLSYFYASGEYGAGLRIAEVTAEHWPRLLPAADPHRHDLTHHQANLLRAVGRYADTERLDRSAHATLSGAYGDLDLLTLRAAGGLAADLRALARYPEALDLSERVHRGYREVLGDDDARTLAARNNVAVTLRLLGCYADALALDRATLEARTALLGSRSGRTLYSELSHAQDLRLLGSYDQALSLQQRNLAMHRAVLGADHPQSLQAAHHLGQCLLETGDAARAGEMVHEVWTACERVLGDTDPLSLRAKVAVSCFERRHGDLERAREADEFVAHHYRRQFGEAHPYAAGVLGNHGLLLRALGDPAATAVLERSLAVMTAAVGEDHPWTLGCALNLAGRRATAGDGAAFERAARGRATAVLGPEHPLTLASTVALAAALRSPGTLEESAKLEGEAIEKLGRVLGSGHPRTVDARARVLPQWDFEPYST